MTFCCAAIRHPASICLTEQNPSTGGVQTLPAAAEPPALSPSSCTSAEQMVGPTARRHGPHGSGTRLRALYLMNLLMKVTIVRNSRLAPLCMRPRVITAPQIARQSPAATYRGNVAGAVLFGAHTDTIDETAFCTASGENVANSTASVPGRPGHSAVRVTPDRPLVARSTRSPPFFPYEVSRAGGRASVGFRGIGPARDPRHRRARRDDRRSVSAAAPTARRFSTPKPAALTER